ncbi:protein phosphatase inhibitor 2 family member C [Drosophila guanche]|uniref:Protein phosphatase inhibitor 2 n=1 Tax=Drosophila guanche TaxID=7266 RepID=A0A3B0JKS1_DROGU|nr:protein phosphatase inhibitor 2 family member C [Drosophila guanche]SPP81413.1 Hypothetical predicted protein [Drosophila guanche]
MEAPKIRGILKNKSFLNLRPVKSASFDEISLMHTTERPEVQVANLPKPAVNSFNISVASLTQELKKVTDCNQYDFNIDTDEDSSDDEYILSETLQERVQRLEFERRRSMHYTEFQSVQLARRLIAEEFSTSTESIESELFSDFVVSSCEAEACLSAESSSEVQKSIEQTLAEKLHSEASSMDMAMEPEVDVEPRLTPSHPCYHQLTAKNPSTLEPTQPNVDPI